MINKIKNWINKNNQKKVRTFTLKEIENSKRKMLKTKLRLNNIYLYLKGKYDRYVGLITIKDNEVRSKFIEQINKDYNSSVSKLYEFTYRIIENTNEQKILLENEYIKNKTLNEMKLGGISDERTQIKNSERDKTFQEYRLETLKKIREYHNFITINEEQDCYLIEECRSQLEEKIRVYLQGAKVSDDIEKKYYIEVDPVLKDLYHYHKNNYIEMEKKMDPIVLEDSMHNITRNLLEINA